jgi:hypothetical protein
MEIKCTQCGAKVPIEKEGGFIRCPYCETALYLDTDRSVKHFSMAPQVREKDLSPTIGRALSRVEINDPLTVGKSRMFYFPFWRLDTAIGGSLTLAAATPPVEDMLQIENPAGDLQLFSPDLAAEQEVVEPELLLEDALLEARNLLESDTAKFRAASILHLPVYEVEYLCQGQRFKAHVLGVTGEVFADEWPAIPQKEKDRKLGAIALFAFILLLLEAVLIPWTWAVIPAYALTGAGVYYFAKNTLRRMGW